VSRVAQMAPRAGKPTVHPNTETGFRRVFFSVRKINWRELFTREGKVKSFLRAVMSIFQFIPLVIKN
jgi:hypothetical protein